MKKGGIHNEARLSEDDLAEELKNYDALIKKDSVTPKVLSKTTRLKIIGRAGGR